MANEFGECVELVRHRLIKLEDRGSKRTLIVENSDQEAMSRVRMDGCVVKQSVCADWVLSKQNVGDLVVELKGSDVAHAVAQVIAAASFLQENGLRQGKLGGVIVCTRYPKVDATILRLRNQFSKRFNGSPLHVAARDIRIDFADAITRHGATLSPHP